MITPTTWG